MHSLKAKIFLIGVLTGLISLILAAANVYSVMQGTQALATVYENQVEPVSALQDIDRNLKEIRFRMAGVLLDQMPATGSKNQLKEAQESIPQQWKIFKDKTSANVFTPEAREQLEKIDKQLVLLPAFLDKLNTTYSSDDRKILSSMLEDEWPLFQIALLKPIAQLVPYQQAAVKATYEKSQANGKQLITIGLIFFTVSILLTILLSVMLFRAISRPLNEAIQIATRVAAGDLTQTILVESRNEFGQLLQALKDMNGNLLELVGEVRAGTQSIASASGQIAAGNLDLSGRTEAQASSLEETAAAMEQLTSTVKQNADNARQANQLAGSASQIASQGSSVVNDLVLTMGGVNDSARKIADIIGVIDGIAFQTNILALNAAVEAARAGEQGRGFAVVATEVRNLAQRSAAAAKEIKVLIDDSVGKVTQGNKQAAQAGATMVEVVSSVQRVTDIMSEISAASHEQSQGIEEVNKAITQMDETTQQNAALVEQAAAAAQAMQDQAHHLETLVNKFQLEGVDQQYQTASLTPVAPPKPAPRRVQVSALPAQKAISSARNKAPEQTQKYVQKQVPQKKQNETEWEEF
jgi:methyl-accepting chemotaxis protein